MASSVPLTSIVVTDADLDADLDAVRMNPVNFAACELQCGEKLENGAFGMVHIARMDTGTCAGTNVAVKRFTRQSPETLASFTNEVTALATLNALQNNHIVRMLAMGTHLDNRVIVLELAQIDLLEFSKVFKKEPRRRFVDWSLQLCSALETLHGCGLVHGDIKSENVGVFCPVQINFKDRRLPNIASITLKLLDFGACTAHGTVPTAWFPGTIRTMAPEAMVKTAPVLRSRDIFSLGIMLWEMVSAQSFYGSHSDSWVRRQLEMKRVFMPARDSNVSKPLYSLLSKMTQLNPDDRPDIAAVKSSISELNE